MEHLKKGAAKEPRDIPTEILVRGVGWIPYVGEQFKKAVDAIRGASEDSRLQFCQDAVIERLQVHEDDIDNILERLDEPELTRLIAVAVERIFFLANERKIKRFAAVIANAVTEERTEQELEDAASFIRALDELSEDDLRVLKVFYHYQKDYVSEGHAMPHAIFFEGNRMTTLQEGIRTLGMQIDDVDSRCNRLVGYGLLVSLERSQHYGDINYHYFRMTLFGKRLMILLINEAEESTEFRARRE
jgi:hypothetical protein